MKSTHTEVEAVRNRCVLGVLVAVLASVLIAGCNATKGLGQDLEESSDNVKNAGK